MDFLFSPQKFFFKRRTCNVGNHDSRLFFLGGHAVLIAFAFLIRDLLFQPPWQRFRSLCWRRPLFFSELLPRSPTPLFFFSRFAHTAMLCAFSALGWPFVFCLCVLFPSVGPNTLPMAEPPFNPLPFPLPRITTLFLFF